MPPSIVTFALLVLGLLLGCQDAARPPAAPGAAQAPAAASSASAAVSTAPASELVQLRTGRLEPGRHAQPLRGTVVARTTHGDQELLRVRFASTAETVQVGDGLRWTVALASSGTQAQRPLVFMEHPGGAARGWGEPSTYAELWVRRPKSETGRPISADAYREHSGRVRGHHFRLDIPETSSASQSPGLVREWAEAFARHLRSLPGDRSLPGYATSASAWHAFAADRILSAYAKGQPQSVGPRLRRSEDRLSSELMRLMETTTGATSIQAALQHDRPLYLEAVKRPRTIPLGKVQAVRVTEHPFADMLHQLARPVPAEPLAEATPAEFYYLRFATLKALFAVVDQAEIWVTPAASIFSRRAEDYDVTERYTTALGVDRTQIARVLGPKVIAEVAVIGSDPYVREGSDVTMLFRVKSRPLFDQGLAAALARHEQRHGALARSKSRHAGVTISLSRSADGAVAQLRADRGELTVLSNSLAAIRRVIEAIRGTRRRLSDEPDFRFMLARDAGTRDDVLGYGGDRFVAEVVGPRQKILEARRQIALAELQTPGYAALLYGWVHGRRPTSRQEVLSSGLLRRDELTHHDGAAIDWKPGRAARSAWGTSRALTPLIDLPAPTRVSRSEQLAYEQFARSYERRWATYVDPFMLRLALEPAGARPEQMVAELRVMPLLRSRDLRDLVSMVGEARLRVPALGQGLRVLLGLGKDARVRQEVSRLRYGLPGGRDLKFDWLGDWVMLGVDDHPVVTRVLAALADDLPQVPLSRAERRRQREQDALPIAAELPGYAVIGIRSRVGAALALTLARSKLVDAVEDIEWGKVAEHNSIPLVRVRYRDVCRPRGRCNIDTFYALTSRALVVALREETLRQVLDELEARPPAAEPHGPDGQLVAELAPQPRGALWTVASWLLEAEALKSESSSRTAAEVLLRGAPDLAHDSEALRELALVSFGAVPLTPDGAHYQLTPEGIADPARGTPFAPVWPAIPVAGSPVEALLQSLRSLRWETSFDDEGQTANGQQLRSLHVRATLALTGAR
jgi:hypothetical protein